MVSSCFLASKNEFFLNTSWLRADSSFKSDTINVFKGGIMVCNFIQRAKKIYVKRWLLTIQAQFLYRRAAKNQSEVGIPNPSQFGTMLVKTFEK